MKRPMLPRESNPRPLDQQTRKNPLSHRRLCLGPSARPGCAWAGCSGTRPIRPSLRARRPWANGVQLGPDEGRIESIITRRDYGARWGGWLGRHKMNLAYRLVSRTYLKTVCIGGGRLLAVMGHTTNNEHTHTCTVHNCTSAHLHSRQSHCLVEMRTPISTLCALISYIPT